jgi:hypothetical protein
VALTPGSVNGEQPVSKNTEVTGFGSSAFFNNDADAHQLWVKINDHLAIVVAFGDKPNEEGAKPSPNCRWRRFNKKYWSSISIPSRIQVFC